MSLVTFRQAVQDQLTAGLGFTVVAGVPLFDRSDDRDIGYVWIERIGEDTSDVQVEVVTLGVRVFKQWKTQEGTHRPVDAFETLIETIQTTLKAIQTTAGPWFFRAVELVPDYESMHVTATLTAWQTNVFSVGG